jgi:DNA mismatch repair protein MutS2
MSQSTRSDDSPPADEVHLRRLTAEEAISKLDKYLHDAFMSGLKQVKVVHGKGTGTLRLLVRRELGKNSLVRSFRPGGPGEGSEGVTIVELAEK